MNIRARKNLYYRVFGSLALFLSLAMPIYSFIDILLGTNEKKILPLISCGAVMVFILFEIIFLLKGWKKDLALQKIAFNENGTRNNVPFIAVIVGITFGIGLLALCLVLFFTKNVEPYRTSSLVILSITVYLLLNCLLYFAYLIEFKKRELDLTKLIR